MKLETYFPCIAPMGPMVETIAWQIMGPCESFTIYGLPKGCQPICNDFVIASSSSECFV